MGRTRRSVYPRNTRIQLPTLDELLQQAAEGLQTQIVRPNINGYTPHAKQVRFHSGTERGKLFVGGNRSGKTIAGVCEDIWRAKGEHPYREVKPAPIQGRVVCVDFLEGLYQIILPQFARWLPPSLLINGSWEDSYGKELRTLTLANGSTIDFMSYEQEVQKFAGVSRDFVHFDEEPPKAIFNENKTRLIDVAGDWYITMTPVDGMTWTYDDLYLKGLNVEDDLADTTNFGKILVTEVDMTDNPFISQVEIDAFAAGLDEDEVKARVHGQYVAVGGQAFKKFNKEIHVIDPVIPPFDWKWYASMDHGYNNPTAWLWHAVSHEGVVITFDELYDRERTVAYYAKRIHERNKSEGRRVPDLYVGDPSITQRQGITGDSAQTAYGQLGIGIMLGNNDISYGTMKMNDYLYHDDETEPKWYITRNCANLVHQLPRMRWDPYTSKKVADKNNAKEKLVKKDDHAADAARYFFTMLPDLRPHENLAKNIRGKLVEQLLKPVSGARVGYTIDDYLRATIQGKPSNTEGQWTVVDENMGGIW